MCRVHRQGTTAKATDMKNAEHVSSARNTVWWSKAVEGRIFCIVE